MQDEAQVHWKSIVEKTVDISELVTTDSKTETWPFVTLRSWDSYAKTETSTFFDFIAVCPLVLQKDLKAWTERTGSSRGNNTGATDRDLATNIQKHYPIWKLFPVKNELVNTDAYSLPQMQTLIEAASNTKGLVVGEVGRTMDQLHNGDGIASNSSDPDSEGSILIYPVFEKLNDASSKMVAIVSANLNWRTFFGHLLPSGVYGVFYVLQDSCGSAKDNRTYTYVVNKGDSKVTYLGVGDYHESKYDYFAFTLAHADSIGGPDISPVIATGNLNCSYVITVYPSTDLASLYSSTNPIIFCSVLTGLFVVMAVAFFAYDKLMQETNIKIIRAVAKTNAFVSSMFPANFHKRLFDLTADPTSTYDNVPGNTTSFDETRKKRQSLSKVYGLTSRRGSNTDDDEDSLFTGKPIADLYPETTIMVCLSSTSRIKS